LGTLPNFTEGASRTGFSYIAQTTLYTITNLASGAHTLTVEVTGAHNESSKGSWIWVDAFDIVR